MQASFPEFPRHTADLPPIWSAPAASPYAGPVPATLTVRVFAYVVDLLAIGAILLVLTLALVTLALPSLGTSLLAIWPVWVATPTLYSALTLSSPAQATFGMRLFGLCLRPVDGGHVDFLTGAGHPLLFYIFGVTMTPFVLLVGLFRYDRALLHDLVLRVRLVSVR